MRLTMVRLQIVGLKNGRGGESPLRAAVHVLHRLACVQIEALADVTVSGVSARPLRLDHDMVREQEELGYVAARIEGMLSALNVAARPLKVEDTPPAGDGPPAMDPLAEARAGLEALGPQVQALVTQQDALQAEQASLPRYEATLRKLLPIMPPSARDPLNVSIGVLVSRAHVEALDAIAERVMSLTRGRAEIVAEDVDAATRAMLIVIPREFAAGAETLLSREDISRLRLPAGFADRPPDEAAAAVGQRLAAIPQELSEIRQQLAALAQGWAGRLV